MWVKTSTSQGHELLIRPERVEAVVDVPAVAGPIASLFLIGRSEPIIIAETATSLLRRIGDALAAGRNYSPRPIHRAASL